MTTTTQQPTCADRINREMAEREEQIRAMIEKSEESEYYGDEESIYDLALSIDTKKITTICLSYGGPADYIEVTHDNNGIYKMVYRFSDWFDTATKEIEEGSQLWDYAALMLEGMGE